jgi:hypothetical protein
MAKDHSHFLYLISSLKQSADTLMPQVVKSQVLNGRRLAHTNKCCTNRAVVTREDAGVCLGLALQNLPRIAKQRDFLIIYLFRSWVDFYIAGLIECA